MKYSKISIFLIKILNLKYKGVDKMGDWYEETYGKLIILGIALLIGGLLFLFLIFPAFFSNITILWWIDIAGIIIAIAFIVIGIIWAIAD